MKKNFIKDLRDVYKIVDNTILPSKTVNPCGECFYCCTSRSNVSANRLELEYLRGKISKEELQSFIDFINHKYDYKNKGLVYSHCPFYNNHGCSIYNIRPYNCRLQGRVRRNKLPNFCVYYEPGETESETYENTPGLNKYREIEIEYNLLTAESEEEKTEAFLEAGMDLFVRDKLKESLAYFHKVIEISPDHGKAMNYINLIETLLVPLNPVIQSIILESYILFLFAKIIPVELFIIVKGF
jgi:Fe-S-cluster containining protein